MSDLDESTQKYLQDQRTRQLEDKVVNAFGNLAIDKRRLPASQLQRRGVPAYVGEWILDSIVPGRGSLTVEEADRVQVWASKYIPAPGDANMVRSRLVDGEVLKLLTPVNVEVELSRNKSERVAKMSLLRIHDAFIPDGLVNDFPDLLNQGMWGVVELVNTGAGVAITSFKPMQATVNLELYKEARKDFTLSEWLSLLMLSMGYNPNAFSEEEQLYILCRLLPLVQKNMHLIELAPKGTGKSYIYENISPDVRLISGGNVSPAVLFVNNASGQWGLLARYSVVVLDEVQTLKFEKPEEIVGGLKGYLANGRLTRGGLHETASDCGLVLLANISLDSHQRPVRDPIVDELPEFLRETAFLDRIRGLIPGWKIGKLSANSFAASIGLKSDFFGNALLALRDDLSHDQYCARRIELDAERPYKRNQDALVSISSGLMKILFPHGIVSDYDFNHYCVRTARELRQIIWNQMQTLDAEYRQYESEIRYKILPE